MSFKEIIEKEKNEIITTLVKQGNANRTIDYSQFLSLYAQYKQIMSEEEFANILGINHEALRNLKRKSTRTVILKQKASEEKNSSALTVALNDFTQKLCSFHGKNSSNISAKDSKKLFFIFGTGNIFESKEGQEILQNGNIFQKDIFVQARAKNNGIEYAQDDLSLVESALEFAKADIAAIEKSAKLAGGGRADGKLSYKDIQSYTDTNDFTIVKDLNLDNKEDYISAEEYASYLLAADSISQSNNEITFENNKSDGIISADEAYLVEKCNDAKIKAIAQKYYDRYFTK